MKPRGCSPRESLKIALLSLLLRGAYLGVLGALTPGLAVIGRFPDSSSYLELATAFQTGQWSDLSLFARRFWPGYPMAVALLSDLLRISVLPAGVIVSVLSASASTYLVARLHGIRVALLFTCLPPDWLFYGSLVYSEALATALVWFSILLTFKSGRYELGMGVAAFSALVRPQGAFLLIAMGIQGLWQRRVRSVLLGTGLALCVAAAWLLFLFYKTGEPFSSITGYGAVGQWKEFPVTFPFAAVVLELMESRVAWVRKIYLVALWAATLGAVVVGARRFRRAAEGVLRIEYIFLFVFVGYSACENSVWDFTAFSRFVLPVFPVILAAFVERLSRWKAIFLIALPASLALAVAIFLRNAALVGQGMQ